MPENQIPPALIGVASKALSDAYTHTQLNSMFWAAGFPGDPPEGSKVAKCEGWLRIANKEIADPLQCFGKLISEFMEAEVCPHSGWGSEPSGTDPRETLRAVMARSGLSYQRNGRIIGATLSAPSRSLAERLEMEGMPALEVEYERAYAQVDSDPPAAVTAACAILESVCKTYLLANGLDLPSKQVLGPLWSATSAAIGLSPKEVESDDLKQVLSGLASIANGIAAVRTHAGSAHGRADRPSESGRKTYKVQSRHARLCVHAAHTMALFVLETWEVRKGK